MNSSYHVYTVNVDTNHGCQTMGDHSRTFLWERVIAHGIYLTSQLGYMFLKTLCKYKWVLPFLPKEQIFWMEMKGRQNLPSTNPGARSENKQNKILVIIVSRFWTNSICIPDDIIIFVEEHAMFHDIKYFFYPNSSRTLGLLLTISITGKTIFISINIDLYLFWFKFSNS